MAVPAAVVNALANDDSIVDAAATAAAERAPSDEGLVTAEEVDRDGVGLHDETNDRTVVHFDHDHADLLMGSDGAAGMAVRALAPESGYEVLVLYGDDPTTPGRVRGDLVPQRGRGGSVRDQGAVRGRLPGARLHGRRR